MARLSGLLLLLLLLAACAAGPEARTRRPKRLRRQHLTPSMGPATGSLVPPRSSWEARRWLITAPPWWLLPIDDSADSKRLLAVLKRAAALWGRSVELIPLSHRCASVTVPRRRPHRSGPLLEGTSQVVCLTPHRLMWSDDSGPVDMRRHQHRLPKSPPASSDGRAGLSTTRSFNELQQRKWFPAG